MNCLTTITNNTDCDCVISGNKNKMTFDDVYLFQ